MGQISNNFTIIKSIIIIFVYASRLKKKISLIFLCSLIHKLSFSKATTLYSLLLGYILEGSNTLLSPSSCVPPKPKSIFSLLVSHFIFPLPIGRTLGLKPKPKLKLSNYLQYCLFIRLFCYSLLDQEYITSLTNNLFSLGLGIHYLFNKEQISFTPRNSLSFYDKETKINFFFFNQET